MRIALLSLALSVAACGGEKREGRRSEGNPGAADIGIGALHDRAWVQQLGGPGDDEALTVSASAEGVYLGGKTAGSWFRPFADTCDPNIDPQHSGEDCADAFVTKLGTDLGIQFGDPRSDEVKFVVASADGVYACGNYREPAPKYQKDGFVTRFPFDLSAVTWESAIRNPGTVDELMGVAVPGHVFVAGGSGAGLAGYVPKDEDDLVSRLDALGTTQKSVQLGAPGLDELMGIAADAAGVYAIGATAGWLDDDPGKNLGSTDVIVLAFDPTLESSAELCRVQLATKGKDVGQAIVASGDHLYLAGYTEGSLNGSCNQDELGPSDHIRSDAFVAKYDKQCQHVWTRQFGTDATDAASSIAVDAEHLYVTGFYGSQAEAHAGITSASHAFVRAYDLDGNVVGEVRFESNAGTDIGQGVAVDAGFVYVAGGTNGVLSTGASLGARDAFLASIPVASLIDNVEFAGDGCD